MKTRSYFILITLLSGIVLPLRCAAQQHSRYKLIDLGTLGGPSAYASVNAPGYRILNDAGTVSLTMDTPAPDPNAPFCYWPDCFVSHAVRWQNGLVTDLGALPGAGNGSASGAINALDISPRGTRLASAGLLDNRKTVRSIQFLGFPRSELRSGMEVGPSIWVLSVAAGALESRSISLGMSSDLPRIQSPITIHYFHLPHRKCEPSYGEVAC